ncbi:exosome non-catalytic core subunit rrp4 [Tulasnella sp. 419]|nr:exosome non-catalytic core subunit rrp4 [Tulasnella sp. 419]
MFSISSPPPRRVDNVLIATKHHPSTYEEDMEVDDEELGTGGTKITSPGQVITSSQAFMRGHGTYVEDEDVLASVAGTIERVNKLVSVRVLKSRSVITTRGSLVISKSLIFGTDTYQK